MRGAPLAVLVLVAACGAERTPAPAATLVKATELAEPAPEPPPPEPPPPEPPPAAPLEPVIRITPEDEDRIESAVREAIAAGAAPGVVVVVGRTDGVILRRAWGRRAVDPTSEPMMLDTIFDLASITKAVATATAVQLLAERGELDITASASAYLPNIRGGYTVEQLLLHTSGLPAVDPLRAYLGDRAADLDRIARIGPEQAPGARVHYSDLGYILLGEIVARVSGRPLEDFVRDEIFEPLGMHRTGFSPAEEIHVRVAPTERAERRGGVMIRGVVHDPRAYRLGGVAGNAGLFSTADDLSRFARMMLGGGELDGVRLLSAATVERITTPRHLPNGSRAMGWDVGRAGLSSRAYGHGGFTGTSLWMDPANEMFVLVLSNRVHPDGSGDVQPLVRALGPLAVAAAQAASPLRESRVSTGIDVLTRRGFATLLGARVALLTHRAARTRDGRRTLDVLRASDVEVVRVLVPEHGLSGEHEGAIEDDRDARTGLPVLGLFGPTRAPTAEMLEGIDTIVIDLQDVGVRFYTYASTVRRVLEAARRADLRVVVLDRPDPLGGGPPRGPVSEPALASFVNHHPLPAVHGMTLGELATLLNVERDIGANLEVVEVQGWSRGERWPDTGLRWVPSSPNLRTPARVLLYPALGLLEGTNLSVGRGTATPFEVIGAPWIDPEALAEALGAIPGLRVEPTRFVPRSASYRGAGCEGLRLTLTDPEAFEPVRAAIAIALALHRLYPDAWEPERMVNALGDRAVFARLLEGASIEELEASWQPGLAAFAQVRQRYLRY